MTIKDRLLAKLKSNLDLPKRTLTVSEEKELKKLLTGYSEDIVRVSRQVKLLKETDNSDLVNAIFTKIEKDFTGESRGTRIDSLGFIYKLKDKILLKKFEDYSIGVVTENKNFNSVRGIISDVLRTEDRELIKKIMAALPPEATSSILTLLEDILLKKFVDIAIEQFSQPQYAGFLPLLRLLRADYLSEEQVTTIINSITVSGINAHLRLGRAIFTRLDYPPKIRLAKKIIEVGWRGWVKQPTMSLEFLVMLLLNSSDTIAKKILILNDNDEYKYGRGTQKAGYTNFIDTVYLMGLVLQLKLIPDTVNINVGEFAIK